MTMAPLVYLMTMPSYGHYWKRIFRTVHHDPIFPLIRGYIFNDDLTAISFMRWCSSRLSHTTAMGSPYKSPACPSTHLLLRGKSNIDIVSPMKFTLVWTTCFYCKPANRKKKYLKHDYDRFYKTCNLKKKYYLKFCSIIVQCVLLNIYICYNDILFWNENQREC